MSFENKYTPCHHMYTIYTPPPSLNKPAQYSYDLYKAVMSLHKTATNTIYPAARGCCREASLDRDRHTPSKIALWVAFLT